MYTEVDTVVQDIISIYDSTEVSSLQNLPARQTRILHYLQRTAEDVWFHRAWPFAMYTDPAIVMTAGEGTLPTNFGRISPEGGLFDSNGNPWVEISYQDVMYLRIHRREQQSRLFSIAGSVWIPNVDSTATFSLAYQTQAPQQALGQTTGFPETFGEALLLGTVMKLKEEEGDAREIWRTDFQAALGKVGTFYVKGSRTQRMPQTIGGMW